MKYAADFRRIARNALSGRWSVAVVAGLIASLLGAVGTNGPEVKLNVTDTGTSIGLELGGQQFFTFGDGWFGGLTDFVVGSATFVVLAALILGVAYFILGNIVGVGYSKFNLDLVDREKEPEIGTLFHYFPQWKTIAAASLLRGLYVFLWSLLLIIPGIVASYSYAMTGYILAEHPELTASEAIEQSKQMMSGNRFRLFCLHFSFIGWSLLCILTLGIGNLWLAPYEQAAVAAFYREVSGTERVASAGETDSFN